MTDLAKRTRARSVLFALVICIASAPMLLRSNAQSPEAAALGTFVGWATNGPAIYKLYRQELTNPPPNASPAWTNPALMRLRQRQGTPTNQVFQFLAPDSLNFHVWTNVIAHTNGRTTQIWKERTHPVGWPTNAPTAAWNHDSLIWGMRGLTALSPCWQGELWEGQIPVTALTSRHGYTRGHGMGEDGVHTNHAGMKVWFVTKDNKVIEATIARSIVRTSQAGGEHRDYTIFFFDRDLPPGIEPMRVASTAIFNSKYRPVNGAPFLIFKTEQRGNVSVDVPGFVLDTWKGGDSGSPNMLPLPGELVFLSGRSTTGPTPAMQQDMDELCRMARVDPKRYQMQWVNLDRFPDYESPAAR